LDSSLIFVPSVCAALSLIDLSPEGIKVEIERTIEYVYKDLRGPSYEEGIIDELRVKAASIQRSIIQNHSF